MIIKNIFAPKVFGEMTAEDVIFRRGVGDLYRELREVLMSLQLEIANTPRTGATSHITGLSDALNKAIASSLSSLGWEHRKAPGAALPQAAVDWVKMHPSGLSYMGDVGLAVEVQFGNHYQFNADVQRFAEVLLEGKIIAGVSVVPTDNLAGFKADRGASFSNCKEKLERWLSIWAGSGAILLPNIMIIGIEQDGFLEGVGNKYKIKAPIFNLEKTKHMLTPVNWVETNDKNDKMEPLIQ